EPQPPPVDLRIRLFRTCWRSDGLRTRHVRARAACCQLRRQDPQGRQACRSSCRATDEVRAGDQPQDRQGARAHHPAVAAAAGGSGHRLVDRRRLVEDDEGSTSRAVSAMKEMVRVNGEWALAAEIEADLVRMMRPEIAARLMEAARENAKMTD